MMQQLAVPKIQEVFRYFLGVGLMYIYIFQPPVIPKIIYPLLELLILLIYIILFNRSFFNEFLSAFKIETFLLLLILLYSLLRDMAGGEIVYFDRFLLWTFQAFVFGFFITKINCQKNYRNLLVHKPTINLFNLAYWAAVIASLLTLLLILNPTFDSFYESIQLDEYYERYENFDFRYRAYGIAENLTFTYSYTLGMFAGYSLLVINKQKYLIIPVITLLIGVMFNARIGFVSILLCLLIIILQRRWKNIFLFFFLSIVAILLYSLLAKDNELSLLLNNNWALDFFYQLSDTFFGTNLSQYGNTFDTLTGRFFVLPQSASEWIFGSGKSLFNVFDNNTDIGYLLQLNYGGLIFLFLIILFIIHTCLRLLKSLKFSHWYTLFFILSVIILNFKGFVFAGTPGGRLLFLLYVYFIYCKRKDCATKNNEHENTKGILTL